MNTYLCFTHLHNGDEFKIIGGTKTYVKVTNKLAVAISDQNGQEEIAHYVTVGPKTTYNMVVENPQNMTSRATQILNQFGLCAFENLPIGHRFYDRREKSSCIKLNNDSRKNAITINNKNKCDMPPAQPVILVRARLAVLKVQVGDILLFKDVAVGDTFTYMKNKYVKIAEDFIHVQRNKGTTVPNCINYKTGNMIHMNDGARVEILYIGNPLNDKYRKTSGDKKDGMQRSAPR